MKTGDLMNLSREERAHRTYQRIVYRKLVDFQTAIRDARRHGAPLGVCGEMDTRNLIEDICKVGDIEYWSIEEGSDYEKPVLPSVETVKDLPIIDVEAEPSY